MRRSCGSRGIVACLLGSAGMVSVVTLTQCQLPEAGTKLLIVVDTLEVLLKLLLTTLHAYAREQARCASVP